MAELCFPLGMPFDAEPQILTRKAIEMAVKVPKLSAMEAISELLLHLQEGSEEEEKEAEQDTWSELQSS